ncbi:hypothetical protein [Aeromonas sp. S9(2024)]|uniref:hypothetical protein n=1 Tax=Aeromonas sp. S9(2024) TaxID=3242882 RepID=UPI00352832E9
MSNIGASVTKIDKNATLSLLLGSVSHICGFAWFIRHFLSICYLSGAKQGAEPIWFPTRVHRRFGRGESIFQQDAIKGWLNKVNFVCLSVIGLIFLASLAMQV